MNRLAGCLLLVTVVGCHEAPPPPPPPKPPEVTVVQPVEETVTDSEDFTGRMLAVGTVQIRARVGGYLDEVDFTDGADVREGDALFRIDPRPYEAEVARAKAAVTQAEARLKRLKLQEERGRQLVRSRNMSQEDYDLIRFDMAESEGALAAAQAAEQLASLNLSYTVIKAPLSGRISRRLVDPGNLVKADDTLLATIVALDPIHAYFDLDERTELKLRRLIDEGRIHSPRDKENPTRVLFSLADESDFTHSGVIDFVDNQVEGSTGTLRMRAVVDNKEGKFSPGLFVRLRVPIGEPRRAVVVDEQALGSDQGHRFVYVVNAEEKAEYRRVEIGMLNKGRRVIEQGLKPGERVVVTGLQRVRPNEKVTVKDPASADADAKGSTKPVALHN